MSIIQSEYDNRIKDWSLFIKAIKSNERCFFWDLKTMKIFLQDKLFNYLQKQIISHVQWISISCMKCDKCDSIFDKNSYSECTRNKRSNAARWHYLHLYRLLKANAPMSHLHLLTVIIALKLHTSAFRAAFWLRTRLNTKQNVHPTGIHKPDHHTYKYHISNPYLALLLEEHNLKKANQKQLYKATQTFFTVVCWQKI